MRFVALKVVDITDNTKCPDPFDTTVTSKEFWKFGVLVKCFWREGIKIWRILDWYDVSRDNSQHQNDFWDVPRSCIIRCIKGNRVVVEKNGKT